MTTLRLRSVSSGYAGSRVLHGVDFEAGDELVAVVGANGSGKSTVLKSVCGLCDVHGGSVLLDREDITGIPPHRVARMGVAYMAQRENVFPGLDVRENLLVAGAYGAGGRGRGSGGGGGGGGGEAGIPGLFSALRGHGHKKAGQLSGGMRQLLAMAMSTRNRPRVILFDEPTAGLSPANARMVLGKVREIREELGCCAVLVEQNVRGALDLCDRCYLMAGGRVEYEGDPRGLLGDAELGRRYLGLGSR